MVYQIYYIPKGSEENSRGYTMFDIEYYLTYSDYAKGEWFSEIHCIPIAEGFIRYMKDVPKGFDYEQFIDDADEIQEIRGLLYEKYDNKPKSLDEARDFHYRVFGKILREKLDAFCEKYGCFLNID